MDWKNLAGHAAGPTGWAVNGAKGLFSGDGYLGGIQNSFFGSAPTADYKAKEYSPDAGAYQIQNQYGGALGQALSGAQGRATPAAQAAQMNLAQSNEGRGMQMGLAQALQARVAGQKPSLAEMQLNRGMEQAIAAQQSQAASARGMSPAAAQRMAATGIANAQGQTNADAAMLRASEQERAESALGQQLAGMRGQDIGVAANQAGMQQQTNLANQQAELANRAQMDSATQAYMQMGMSREEAQQKALAEMEALKAQQRTSANQVNAGVAQANLDTEMKHKGGLLSAAGGAFGAMLSDRRAKENISDGGKGIDELMGALKPKRFDYKKEHGGEKDFVGFMAQDAERSALGRTLVRQTDRGDKMIDAPRALMAALAATSRLHHRLSKIEGGRGQ